MKEYIDKATLIAAIKKRLKHNGTQPKQGWKQENTGDLTAFENAMMHIGGSFFGQHAGLDPNDTNSIKEQANLLLELVPSKEWNEEDESMLNEAIYFIRREPYCENDAEPIVDWLNGIKQRIKKGE